MLLSPWVELPCRVNTEEASVYVAVDKLVALVPAAAGNSGVVTWVRTMDGEVLGCTLTPAAILDRLTTLLDRG